MGMDELCIACIGKWTHHCRKCDRDFWRDE